MFVIDTPISLLIGTAVALNSQGGVRSIDQPDRAFSRGLLIQSLFITPLIVFFLTQYPDWELSYLLDARSVMESEYGSWLALAFTMWLTALYVVGFKLGETLINRGRRSQLSRIVKGLMLLIVVVTGVVFRETIHLGSTAQFHANTAVSVTESTTFMMLVLLGLPGWIAAYCWAIKPTK